MKGSDLQKKIYELRELLNSSISHKQGVWDRKSHGDWSKLWTAVDNIEDTQLAIDEYCDLKSFSRLAVYGLLQSMVVQQDGITHLEEALQIEKPNWPNDYPDLAEIREIRRETVGHPTETKKRGGFSYTSISHTNKFLVLEYGVWSLNDKFEHKTINLEEVIKTQCNLLMKELDRIIKKIEDDEHNHKMQFQNQSLSEILKATSYYIQKLWPFERDRIYSDIMFKSLRDAFERFRAEIKKRYGVDDFAECINIPGVVDIVAKVEKLLPRIEEMLPMGRSIDSFNLEVYVESLSNAFDDLRIMAKEIDEEFANKTRLTQQKN